MGRKGITLIELMVVVILIPIVGLTVVQIDQFVNSYFFRSTRGMLSEQEVEIAFGRITKDILVARSITVYSDAGTWAAPVNPGTAGNGIELTADDGILGVGHTPDDVIRYSVNGANELVREYDVDGSGTFDAGQTIARSVTSLDFLQTVTQPNFETGPGGGFPQNVVQVTVSASVGQTSASRTRYITSRALRAIP